MTSASRPDVDLSALDWRKATASGGNGNGCVEFARVDADTILIRDSKDPAGPALWFNRHEIECLLAGARGGEFDDLAQ